MSRHSSLPSPRNSRIDKAAGGSSTWVSRIVTSCATERRSRFARVAPRRDGKFVYYRLVDEAVLTLLAALRRLAERNVAEVQQVVSSYFQKRDELEPVSRERLMELSRAGAVTVLDVRPSDEFELGHVPGAVNIPLRELETRLAELDPSQEIIAYCRGHYCVLSYEAVATLRTRGFKARRLEEGLPEWRAAGLPIVIGREPQARGEI
jgi:rhodanese-related sulfurtransferase